MLGRGVDKAADLAAARKVLAARSQHDNGQCRIGLGPLASGLRGHEIEAYVIHPTSAGVPREHRRAKPAGKDGPVPSLLKPDSLIYCDGLFNILVMRRELRLQNAGILSIAAR